MDSHHSRQRARADALLRFQGNSCGLDGRGEQTSWWVWKCAPISPAYHHLPLSTPFTPLPHGTHYIRANSRLLLGNILLSVFFLESPSPSLALFLFCHRVWLTSIHRYRLDQTKPEELKKYHIVSFFFSFPFFFRLSPLTIFYYFSPLSPFFILFLFLSLFTILFLPPRNTP